jgi:hypothetical protein
MIKPKLYTKTRKDSAVHVSLSSFQLVKQPDADASISPKGRNLYLRSSKVRSIRRHPVDASTPKGANQ